MKQETGNKTTRDSALKSILSIRLSPDGFYFKVIRNGKTEAGGSCLFDTYKGQPENKGNEIVSPAESLSADAQKLSGYIKENELFNWEYAEVWFVVDTSKAVLFPEGEGIDTDMLFEECGMPISGNEIPVVSRSINGIGAVIAIDRSLHTLLTGLFRDANIVHPLLGLTEPVKKNRLKLYITAANIHMTLMSGSGLGRAEAVPYKGQEDVIYFAQQVISGGRKVKVQLYGEENVEFGAELRKRFPIKRKGHIPAWLW